METKKSIVKSVRFNRKWNNIHYYDIFFENGDKGEFSTNKEPQTKFIVGTEEEYTILTEEKEKKSGIGTWTKFIINKPKNTGTFGGGYKSKFDPNKQRRIAKSVGLRTEIKLKHLFGIKSKTFEIANEISNWILINGKEDEAMHICCSASINIAIEVVENMNTEKGDNPYSNTTEFLKLASSLFKYIIT